MTFEREIYFILKNANKPMTTTEIIEAITVQYCGDEKKDYNNYIFKMESWANELKTQGTNIKQRVVDALKIIVNHKYAKTWTTNEELNSMHCGGRKTYHNYTFRHWQAIK